MNPLFNAFQPVNQNPDILQRLQQFASTFQGDPRQQVQMLLNSGRVSPQQYNWAVQTAQQLQQLMNQPRRAGLK